MNLIVTPDKKFLKVVSATDIELKQLQMSLTKRIKNWRFHPLCKRGVWDGYIKFIDANNRIPIGLWNYVMELCKEYSFEFNVADLSEIYYDDFDENDFDEFIIELFKNHKKIKPHDYQIAAAKKILKWKRCIAELATSAGKTLIMFMIFSYLLKRKKLKKMLIIVPRSGLVIQTIEDFEDYSQNKKVIKYFAQMLGGGRDKLKKDVQLIVGTYQTLTKLEPEFFEDVDVVCVDESHHSDTKSIKNILKMCPNANFRFGLSGTTKVNENDADSLNMISLLGPLVERISGKYLTDNGYATPINIKMIFMDYLDEETKEGLFKMRNKLRAQQNINNNGSSAGSKLLNIEQKLIISNKKRFNFICDFITKLPKNSLVLFRDVQNGYGEKIYTRLKRTLPDEYEVFYVDGGTDQKNRDIYKKRMDRNDGRPRILVASFGTFSTGISINAIDNVLFLESYKSEVIIKQSIGRGMRKNKDKDIVNIIDFVDDFSVNGWPNYSLNHAYDRENIYKNEKYKYKKINVKL